MTRPISNGTFGYILLPEINSNTEDILSNLNNKCTTVVIKNSDGSYKNNISLASTVEKIYLPYDYYLHLRKNSGSAGNAEILYIEDEQMYAKEWIELTQSQISSIFDISGSTIMGIKDFDALKAAIPTEYAGLVFPSKYGYNSISGI